jgi:spore coat polysaccharide biosynthesis protein SpsF
MKQVANQVIIQARTGSTRLPGKVMMMLENRRVIEHVVFRSGSAMKDDRVVVATTDLSGDDQIYGWCQENNVPCVRGSSEDVLARYVLAAETFPCQNINRITDDCP